MTEVTFIKSKNGFEITAKGHAKTPVICSAISCLMFSCAGYLENSDVPHAYRLNDGDAMVWFSEGKELYKFMKVGLAQIEAEYPDSIKITETLGEYDMDY